MKKNLLLLTDLIEIVMWLNNSNLSQLFANNLKVKIMLESNDNFMNKF